MPPKRSEAAMRGLMVNRQSDRSGTHTPIPQHRTDWTKIEAYNGRNTR